MIFSALFSAKGNRKPSPNVEYYPKELRARACMRARFSVFNREGGGVGGAMFPQFPSAIFLPAG